MVRGEACECLPPCRTGSFPCIVGHYCASHLVRSVNDKAELVCLPALSCGDCEGQLLVEDGATVCGPDGTALADGMPAPQCGCNRDTGECEPVCLSSPCPTKSPCVERGFYAGQCKPLDCAYHPCLPGELCQEGKCVPAAAGVGGSGSFQGGEGSGGSGAGVGGAGGEGQGAASPQAAPNRREVESRPGGCTLVIPSESASWLVGFLLMVGSTRRRWRCG